MSDKGNWDGTERRRSVLDEEELVKAVVCAVRNEVAILSVSQEEHREHHAFIQEWIEEVRMKRERREKIKTQVAGWAIIAVLSGIGTGAYNAFVYLKEHLK